MGAPPRFLFPALALLYLWPFPYFEALHSPNELSRLYQARALAEDGTVHLAGPLSRSGPVGDLSEVCPGGRPCEPAAGWLSRCTGGQSRCFPNKAPGVALAGAPVVFLLSLFGPLSDRTLLFALRLLLCALPTLLLLRALFPRLTAWSGGDRSVATALLLAYGAGSLGYTYSLLYFSHQPAAVLLFTAFLLLEGRGATTARRRELLAGLAATSAVVCEYTVAPAAAAVLLYGVLAVRSGGAAPGTPVRSGGAAPGTPGRSFLAARGATLGHLAAGAALPAALLLAYHQAAFGHPLSTGYSFNVNRTFQGWHDQGFFGLSAPSLAALAGNLLGPRRGLFFFSPFLLLGLCGLPLLARDRAARAHALLVAAILAFYCFVAASFLFHAWGWSLGPRHLTPLVPFLLAPAAYCSGWLRRLPRAGPVAGGAAAGLCALSLLVTGLPSIVWPHFDDALSCGLRALTLPLLSEGRLPWNLFSLLTGVTSVWSWAPWFAAFAVALAAIFGGAAAGGEPRSAPARLLPRSAPARLLAPGTALGVCLLGGALLLRLCPAPDARGEAGLILAHEVWEPEPSSTNDAAGEEPAFP